MAKIRSNVKTLDSFTIPTIGKSITAGDCVLMVPSDPSGPLRVAKVMKLRADNVGSKVNVYVQWYYRPEETMYGRKWFHGIKELFLSDHHEIQSVDTIVGKCKVHRFRRYMKLRNVGDADFFCRFQYYTSTGDFYPRAAPVICHCERPLNPDQLIFQCDECRDKFHPSCVNLTPVDVIVRDDFFCAKCVDKAQRILNQ